MGAIYKKPEPRKKKGRLIYNRDRLHKVGWTPKHKLKYRIIMKFMDKEINDMHLICDKKYKP